LQHKINNMAGHFLLCKYCNAFIHGDDRLTVDIYIIYLNVGVFLLLLLRFKHEWYIMNQSS